ncbi:Uncharacterised protein [Serratia marcescens]|nr:Uncharacterised protein [Serratia marcescens]CAI1054458.1 Uncharacterised protein [Serratia marcescens]
MGLRVGTNNQKWHELSAEWRFFILLNFNGNKYYAYYWRYFIQSAG